MSAAELNEYEFIKTDYLNKCFDDMNNIDFFALTQLLQSHYCSATEKCLKLNRLIDDIDGKVIVFVKYLNSIPDGALKVVGEMNTEQRAEAIQRFKDGEKVLYITYGCGAYGKKAYQDMTAEEKEVIDSFQGEEAYNNVMAKSNYYLAPVVNNQVLRLE